MGCRVTFSKASPERRLAKLFRLATRVLLGPVLLYKPTRETHLGLVPLFGLTSDAPVAEVFVVFGIDFEPFSWFGSNKSESGKGERGFEPVRRPR